MRAADFGASFEIGHVRDGEITYQQFRLSSKLNQEIMPRPDDAFKFAALRWMGHRIIACISNPDSSAIWVYSWPTLDKPQSCIARNLRGSMGTHFATVHEFSRALITESMSNASQQKNPARILRVARSFYSEVPFLETMLPSSLLPQE
jgi:hypothetical protein